MDRRWYERRNHPRHDHPGAAVTHPYGTDSVRTFMYVSARSAGDDEYKRDFLTPLIEDLHTTLIARNRYRNEPTNAR